MLSLVFTITLIIYISSILLHVIELSKLNKCKTLCGGKNIQFKNRLHISGIVADLIMISIIFVLTNRGLNKWAWGVLASPFILSLIYIISCKCL